MPKDDQPKKKKSKKQNKKKGKWAGRQRTDLAEEPLIKPHRGKKSMSDIKKPYHYQPDEEAALEKLMGVSSMEPDVQTQQDWFSWTPFQRIEDTIIHPDGKPAEREEGDSEEKPTDTEDKTEETEQPADDAEAPAEEDVKEPVTEETTEEQPTEDADAEKSEETPEAETEDKSDEPEEPVAEEAEEEQPSEEAEEPAADEQSEEPAAEEEETPEDAEVELDARNELQEDFGLKREWFEIPNDFLEEEGPYAIRGYEEPIFAPFDGPLYEPFLPMVDPYVPLEEAMAVPVAPVVPEWWNPDHFVGRMPEFGVFPPLAPFSPLELDNAAMGDRAAYRNNNEEVMVLRTPNFSIAW